MKSSDIYTACCHLAAGWTSVFFGFALFLSIINIRTSAQNNFIPGEKLKYIVYFGPINAGMADIHLARTFHNNQEVFYSKLSARSIGLPDKLYKVKDTYESYFDSMTLLPAMAIRDIREGRYKKKNIDTFNHQKNAVYSVNKGEIKTPAGIRDVITTYYFVRNYDFRGMRKGDVMTVNIFFDDELIAFRLYYMGKEKIETRNGEMNCIKLIPEMVETKKNEPAENISPTPKDEMIIWLSDDPNQVPVRVRFDLLIGSIKADLIEYINLKY
jgi:hypothetical protein